MTTIDNGKGMPASTRRKAFLAEVWKRQAESGLSFDEAFTLVLADAEYGGEVQVSNDVDPKADKSLADASKRTVIIQQKVNELLKAMNWGADRYNTAFNLVLKQNPELAKAMHQPGKPDPQSFRQFNFADPAIESKTSYSQQAGFRTPATPMPKTNLGSKAVGDWSGTGGRPYVETLVKA
jgi:hypothetical protein